MAMPVCATKIPDLALSRILQCHVLLNAHGYVKLTPQGKTVEMWGFLHTMVMR